MALLTEGSLTLQDELNRNLLAENEVVAFINAVISNIIAMGNTDSDAPVEGPTPTADDMWDLTLEEIVDAGYDLGLADNPVSGIASPINAYAGYTVPATIAVGGGIRAQSANPNNKIEAITNEYNVGADIFPLRRG